MFRLEGANGIALELLGITPFALENALSSPESAASSKYRFRVIFLFSNSSNLDIREATSMETKEPFPEQVIRVLTLSYTFSLIAVRRY
jgi:hypothetical protein